jgi:hypothetical protein
LPWCSNTSSLTRPKNTVACFGVVPWTAQPARDSRDSQRPRVARAVFQEQILNRRATDLGAWPCALSEAFWLSRSFVPRMHTRRPT